MSIVKIAALGALGYLGFKYLGKSRQDKNEAFAEGEAGGENFAQIRNAGPAAMADKPKDWSKTDQASDESFPASDPPGNY